MSNAELEEARRELQEYFSKDNRFTYRRLISQGCNATAHHVQYTDYRRPALTQFLVKRSLRYPGMEEDLRIERDILTKLRGGMHIVQIVDIQDNPLQRHNLAGEWLILEWVPNGTFGDFISKAARRGTQRLPNRLLCRIFLCLVRSCIGMAWPRHRPGDRTELEFPYLGFQPGNLQHNDMHLKNVVLGEFLPHVEHGFTPIIKLIDFGLTRETDGVPTAVQQNIFAIGVLMVKLITIDPNTYVRPQGLDPFMIRFNGENIQTQANAIFTPQGYPLPGLDDWLAYLVAICLASDPHQQPTLQKLSGWLTAALTLKTAAQYMRNPEEGDNAIRSLCQQIILNPVMPDQPGSTVTNAIEIGSV
ncbi:kinase-like protein [Annulohypoxylon bovei var. microspora]|nr:kinase-like protein [Annulohypoxylon bovei var. microspora]